MPDEAPVLCSYDVLTDHETPIETEQVSLRLTERTRLAIYRAILSDGSCRLEVRLTGSTWGAIAVRPIAANVIQIGLASW